MKPSAQETGLIVPVPEISEFVNRWRAELEPVAPQGVPAHITLMYPFIHPASLQEHDQRVAALVAGCRPFEFLLASIGWFRDEVVYLEPRPAEPFRVLTDAIATSWPELKPYGGQHPNVVPHLTLAKNGVDLARVAVAARQLLPIRSTAREVWLMEGQSDPPIWQVRRRYELGKP